MQLTRHQMPHGTRWAVDGYWLPVDITLSKLLELSGDKMRELLHHTARTESANGKLLAPIDPLHEVWAAGVTYLRSREARREESAQADMYDRIYDAVRPELFFKAIGWRVVGHQMPIRIRGDSRWNVPEPELVLVVNRENEIVGYCAGNDVSSRDIEGENPLYLPQAKIYSGSCALGQAICLAASDELCNLQIHLELQRQGATVFSGETTTAKMKRTLAELVAYLTREVDFPQGAFLMTGTGIVPGNEFSLMPGDHVRIQVGSVMVENRVCS